ncbi:MAG: hypothetical protein WBL68_19180 [Nitrososphaeraceae archaeon]|jgi:hypothetical protein
MNNHVRLWITTLLVSLVTPSVVSFQSSSAQTDAGNTTTEQGIITSNGTFASSLDLYVVPESVGGYGVYEKRLSNTFAPGEDIVLYSEPIGFSYKPIVSNLTNDETQYLMNFTADLVITDTEGNVLGGFQDLPISEIISHHQNKEVNLVITLSQSSPFPEGNYKVLYTVHDEPSGNTFEITKDITISSSSSI